MPGGGPDGVDLGERAEGALPADADLVSALHVAFDLAFHRQPGAERISTCRSVAAPRASLRESVRPPSVDTTTASMRSPTATSSAVGVLQFGDLDERLALATDVDERHLRADADDRPLDRLPFSTRFAWYDASNIEAKSSSCSVTARS